MTDLLLLFEISLGNNYIAEFDKSGNFKRKIGSNDDCDKYHMFMIYFLSQTGRLGFMFLRIRST